MKNEKEKITASYLATLEFNKKFGKEKLKEIADKIEEINPKKVYIFFNNNHNMLLNAQLMKKLL